MMGIDDEWVVDGKWKLKINHVKATDQRNSSSNKIPKMVVEINYTYENVGNQGNNDLYIQPKTVLDETGDASDTYGLASTKFAKAIPMGGKVTANYHYSLNNESKKIRVYFENYDDSSKKHRASFELEVK